MRPADFINPVNVKVQTVWSITTWCYHLQSQPLYPASFPRRSCVNFVIYHQKRFWSLSLMVPQWKSRFSHNGNFRLKLSFLTRLLQRKWPAVYHQFFSFHIHCLNLYFIFNYDLTLVVTNFKLTCTQKLFFWSYCWNITVPILLCTIFVFPNLQYHLSFHHRDVWQMIWFCSGFSADNFPSGAKFVHVHAWKWHTILLVEDIFFDLCRALMCGFVNNDWQWFMVELMWPFMEMGIAGPFAFALSPCRKSSHFWIPCKLFYDFFLRDFFVLLGTEHSEWVLIKCYWEPLWNF